MFHLMYQVVIVCCRNGFSEKEKEDKDDYQQQVSQESTGCYGDVPRHRKEGQLLDIILYRDITYLIPEPLGCRPYPRYEFDDPVFVLCRVCEKTIQGIDDKNTDKCNTYDKYYCHQHNDKDTRPFQLFIQPFNDGGENRIEKEGYDKGDQYRPGIDQCHRNGRRRQDQKADVVYFFILCAHVYHLIRANYLVKDILKLPQLVATIFNWCYMDSFISFYPSLPYPFESSSFLAADGIRPFAFL